MKFSDILTGLALFLALVFAYAFFSERKRREYAEKIMRKLEGEKRELELAYFDLLERVLELEKKMTPDIQTELTELKRKAGQLDEAVHIELSGVLDQVQAGKHEKATRDLGKIVENLLKQKIATDASFKANKTLNNMLDHALNCQWINKADHALGKLLRDHRNKESHELAVKEPNHVNGLLLFGGIKLVYTLFIVGQ